MHYNAISLSPVLPNRVTNMFLLHCYFELNVHFTYANNLRVLDFLVCVSFDSLFSNSYKCLIHSKFEIKIYFFPQRRSSKNKTILYSVWLLRYTVGLRLPVCVCFFKIHKYIASSPVSKAQQFQSLHCRTQTSFTIHLKMCLFRCV